MEKKIKNHTVYFDEKDSHFFDTHNWYVHKAGKKFYLRGYLKGKRKSGLVYFHRLICKAKEVDHIDGDGLNNCRNNLRACSRSQNNANRQDFGSKGVHFEKSTGKYRALIHINGKKISIGRFDSFQKAKSAYNKKARELFKGFANTI